MVKHENKICKLGLTFCKLELRPLFLEKERNKVISAQNSAIQIRISYFFPSPLELENIITPSIGMTDSKD